MRQGVRILTMLTALVFFCPFVHASENIVICAKNTETGQMYHAMASNASGLDLNRASHSSQYDAMQNYIVILWDESHFSIVQIQPPFSVPSYFPETGMDQDGHPWEISLYSSKTCP